ncbi:MAG: class I SAM-dependent methyltransferase, partial [Candidatus Ranarchaeia archaeon]
MSQLFDVFASVYDTVIDWRARLKRELLFIRKILGLPPRLVLDAACGVGRHASMLAVTGYTVVGIDTSKSMLEKAQKHAKEREEKHRVYLCLASVAFLPFRSSVFSRSMCLGTSLPLLSLEDIQRSFTGLCLTLRQKGVFLGQTRDFALLGQMIANGKAKRFLSVRHGVLDDGRNTIFLRFYDLEG